MSTVETHTQHLIPALCQQFSQATGWRLEYTPIDPELDEQGETLAAQLRDDPHCPWFAPVTDGHETMGYLRLETPGKWESHSDFDQVADFARSLTHLLDALSTAAHRLESRDREVSMLVNLGLAVPAQDNLPWALTQLLKAAVHLTTARSAAFFLLDSTVERLKLRAAYRIEADDVPHSQRDLSDSHGQSDLTALLEGICRVRAGQGISQSAMHALLPPDVRSGLCVAVQSETVPIGTLWVYDRRDRDFSQRDSHVLLSIAAQIAAVLERHALLRGSEEQERIRHELKLVSESGPGCKLQSLPEDPRWELAGSCSSCFEVGGDLCEVIPLNDDQVALVVGDASGNSIPAAMIMSAVRGAVRTHPAGADEVIPMVGRLNEALYSITHSHQFMSLCYGVFDAAQRRFTYCNAGHPTPLLVRNGQVTPLESHGLLLGVLRETGYESSTIELQPGDVLVFYSDGISEARSLSQQMFRSEGIADAVLACADRPATEILQRVWSKAEAHMAGGDPADDRTLLVLRVR